LRDNFIANGTRGDDPILDIMAYGSNVFSARADQLIRDVLKLMDTQRTEALRRDLLLAPRDDPKIIANLEDRLERLKQELVEEAQDRGSDISRLTGAE
jgi:CBS domain-containing protein